MASQLHGGSWRDLCVLLLNAISRGNSARVEEIRREVERRDARRERSRAQKAEARRADRARRELGPVSGRRPVVGSEFEEVFRGY